MNKGKATKRQKQGPKPDYDHIYGIWRHADGRRTIFNRSHKPEWIIHPGETTAVRADPTIPPRDDVVFPARYIWGDWDIVAQRPCPETRREIRAICKAWGISL